MDKITVSVPAEEGFYGLLRLVVGGIASRSRLSYEQTNELQLAVETLVAGSRAATDTVAVEAGLGHPTLTLLLGPFETADLGGRRVIERLVDDVDLVSRDGATWIQLTVAEAQAAESRSGPA